MAISFIDEQRFQKNLHSLQRITPRCVHYQNQTLILNSENRMKSCLTVNSCSQRASRVPELVQKIYNSARNMNLKNGPIIDLLLKHLTRGIQNENK